MLNHQVLLVIFFLLCVQQCTSRNWKHSPFIFETLSNNDHQKVVGGQVAEPHSFPHQVALFMELEDKTRFCGGSLISTRYVLTAAHCPIDALSIEVVLGAHNIRDSEESSQVRIIAERYILHEGYESDFNVNDIALVVLPENSVYLSDTIQIVKLPSYSDAQNDFVDESSTISGWGKTSDPETTYTDLLRYVETPIITNEECRMWYFGLFVEETNICASGMGGKSPCNGDSGGALLINNMQVGIASFGVGFGCEVDFPGAYTRVTSYLKWIEDNSDVIINL